VVALESLEPVRLPGASRTARIPASVCSSTRLCAGWVASAVQTPPMCAAVAAAIPADTVAERDQRAEHEGPAQRRAQPRHHRLSREA
jgi:hypothetical protein